MSEARVGVLGGTFDPIHEGHLVAGRAAMAALGLDRMLVVPSHDPPHRPDSPRASGYHRLQMASLGIADMPGGVHLRLVAPLDWRTASVARDRGITPEVAGGVVRETDRNREAFLKQHWPSRSMTPESFTATFNAAAIEPELLVESMAMITLRAILPAKLTASP